MLVLGDPIQVKPSLMQSGIYAGLNKIVLKLWLEQFIFLRNARNEVVLFHVSKN